MGDCLFIFDQLLIVRSWLNIFVCNFGKSEDLAISRITGIPPVNRSFCFGLIFASDNLTWAGCSSDPSSKYSPREKS